ncbi:hypothetical protein LCGC14_0335450 [marine sediment metagenome]|uniref:Glycogen debranching enzyme C-terminal domain-containing protein n=1 Tax=marine sediment metagenome TaxID=412755 RepID=A0A0F9W2M2_9ZZZZ|nr:glycogen debranching protein [Phycisphaerae bacterium]HDZ43751.1 glycogen debranching protein [Phycisphaerae bacterium]
MLAVMNHPPNDKLPPPLTIDCRDGDLDELLNKEWLIANGIGAYASASITGCNTRRYHGLLVAAAQPPVGRIMALATVMEHLDASGQTHELATNEFDRAMSPQGWRHLETFVNDVAPRFVFRIGDLELTKKIILAESANAVVIRYTLRGGSATLHVRPFAALRDYHHVRSAEMPHRMTFDRIDDGVVVHDRTNLAHSLYLTSTGAAFQASPQWWYAFCYRADIARGQGEPEDTYSPGMFICELADGQSCEVQGGLDEAGRILFASTHDRRRQRLAAAAAAVGDKADDTARRLAVAGDAFIVRRQFVNAPSSATILAGFHWFADWGRDAFIALPGLCLATGRFDVARQVFKTFAAWISDGLAPNCFDDDGTSAHYNSIDASLWFIIAAERYLQATGDTEFWSQQLLPAAAAILQAYHDGTRFDIHADGDCLLMGGSPQTQLTWMDAAVDDDVFTPRYGKAVEINALWYAAQRIMEHRCRGIDDGLADQHGHLAELIAPAFAKTFWNQRERCLYDCLCLDGIDDAIRPNQIFAVSLPYSPLSTDQQRDVVRVVQTQLLTPVGLRTLASSHPAYRGSYSGDRLARDRAYHQGTVWPWLIGPFIEAYLKVHEHSPAAADQAESWLSEFDAHLGEAGLGTISEVFDGDEPRQPGGCIAQAWSVAEVLRAKLLVAACREPVE